MTSNIFPKQFIVALCSIVLSTAVFADGDQKDDAKSSADTNVTAPVAKIKSAEESTSTEKSEDQIATKSDCDVMPSAHMKFVSEMEKFQKMEEQWYQERREAHRKLMEDRSTQFRNDIDSQRNEFIKHMEQRREFFNRLHEQRLEEIEQKRQEMLQKTYKTENQAEVKESDS